MDTNDNTRQITVLLAGRPYPLKIQAKDEVAIRRIIKEVNDKIDKFQVTYPHREQKDCMALSLLSYAVDLHKFRQNPVAAAQQESAEFAGKLTDLDALLDILLNE